MRSVPLTVGAALLSLAVGCARKAPPAAGANVVTITATDFAFGAPDTIPAGLTTLRLVNRGADLHHAVLIRIPDGMSRAAVDSAMRIPGPPAAWMSFGVSPIVTLPGDSTNATSMLEPGLYLMVCFIAGADRVPHVAKGMTRWLEVVGPAAAAAEPQADVVITLADYSFQLSTPLTAGTHTVRVENNGAQMHEVGIERLAEGKSLADYMAWDQGGRQGPPPVAQAGGVIGPDVGKRGYFTVSLAPGKYLLTCYVPDKTD
ncbi:MAG: hypothetical protein ACREKB_05160, partial [Candidatus Rokuibacteriota bacterium]